MRIIIIVSAVLLVSGLIMLTLGHIYRTQERICYSYIECDWLGQRSMDYFLTFAEQDTSQVKIDETRLEANLAVQYFEQATWDGNQQEKIMAHDKLAKAMANRERIEAWAARIRWRRILKDIVDGN